MQEAIIKNLVTSLNYLAECSRFRTRWRSRDRGAFRRVFGTQRGHLPARAARIVTSGTGWICRAEGGWRVADGRASSIPEDSVLRDGVTRGSLPLLLNYRLLVSGRQIFQVMACSAPRSLGRRCRTRSPSPPRGF